MIRQFAAFVMLAALSACGQSGEQAAPGQTIAPAFRTDADLIAVPLDSIVGTADGFGTQYIERISPGGGGLRSEPGPSGPTPTIVAPTPTTFTVTIPANSQEFVVMYGMSPESYTNGGTTKGACFAVAAVEVDGPRELAQRCLTPVETPSDQGFQEFAVQVPPGVTQFQLQTTPAAASGELTWGWSFWANPRAK
jgi:hypothetical protein